MNSNPVHFFCRIQQVSTHVLLTVYSVCALKNLVFIHRPGSVKRKQRKCLRLSQTTLFQLINDRRRSSQSQYRKRKGSCVCFFFSVVALALHVVEFVGGASEGSVKSFVFFFICLGVEFKY